jgi:hypothetical protein
LHNGLVQAKINEAAVGFESQKLERFAKYQDKLRHASENRESRRAKKSGLNSNAA